MTLAASKLDCSGDPADAACCCSRPEANQVTLGIHDAMGNTGSKMGEESSSEKDILARTIHSRDDYPLILDHDAHAIFDEKDKKQKIPLRPPVHEQAQAAFHKRLARRRASVVVILCAATFWFPSCWAVVSALVPSAASAAGVATLASFLPEDADMRSPIGTKITVALSGTLALAWITQLSTPEKELYPYASQRSLHIVTYALLFAWNFGVCCVALIPRWSGGMTWAYHRLGIAITGTSGLLALVGLQLLEGDHGVAGLFLGRPHHACYLAVCINGVALAETWVAARVEAVGMIALALVTTPGWRRWIATRTRFAHVHLRLADVKLKEG